MALTQQELKVFPSLRMGRFREMSRRTTTRRDVKYNCIAFAAGDTTQRWWPPVPTVQRFYYWPAGIPVEETLDAFMSAFASLGYTPCSSPNLEPRIEKVAFFVKPNGVPGHVAIQRENGMWHSKLGDLEDIEHNLRDLECATYGTVQAYMQRTRRDS